MAESFLQQKNQINVSNQVINAGDGWWKGWGAAIVMLRQVWQMSDTADSVISASDPLVPSLAKKMLLSFTSTQHCRII